MKVTTLVPTIVGTFAIIGGLYSLDATYARSEQLCKVEQRLDRKILSDDMMRLQQRQWRLKDRYGEDEAVKLPEYREIEQQRQMILRELER
jgi:protein-tyrosine-phosphatase